MLYSYSLTLTLSHPLALVSTHACPHLTHAYSHISIQQGYHKRAQSLVGLRRYEEAAATCAHALRLDPTNQPLQKLLNQAVQENITTRRKEEFVKQQKEAEKAKGDDKKSPKKASGNAVPKEKKEKKDK